MYHDLDFEFKVYHLVLFVDVGGDVRDWDPHACLYVQRIPKVGICYD